MNQSRHSTSASSIDHWIWPRLKEPDDPDCVILAEQAINEYLKNEVDALKAALARVGEAIDEEAGKRQDEDWSVMIGYVQSCVEKLPGANEDWEQN
jgi:hypothetical protein